MDIRPQNAVEARNLVASRQYFEVASSSDVTNQENPMLQDNNVINLFENEDCNQQGTSSDLTEVTSHNTQWRASNHESNPVLRSDFSDVPITGIFGHDTGKNKVDRFPDVDGNGISHSNCVMPDYKHGSVDKIFNYHNLMSYFEPSTVIDKFNETYSQKLIHAANSSNNQVELLEGRVRILQSYIVDLKEQNKFLVTTVENLEKETNNRVESLESKLYKTADISKEYMNRVCDYEQNLNSILADKKKADTLIDDLHRQIKSLNNENNILSDHNANLQHDIQSLIKIIQRAKDTGSWQIDNVTFCEVSFEDVYGSPRQLSPYQSKDSLNCHGSYQGYFNSKPQEESKLSSNFNSPASSMNMMGLNEQELINMKLQMDLRSANRTNESMHNEILEKHRIISELESRITELHHELVVRDTEVEKCRNTIQNQRQSERKASLDLSCLDEQVKHLKLKLAQCSSGNTFQHISHLKNGSSFGDLNHHESKGCLPCSNSNHLSSGEISPNVSCNESWMSETVGDSGIVNDSQLHEYKYKIQQLTDEVCRLKEARDHYEAMISEFKLQLKEVQRTRLFGKMTEEEYRDENNCAIISLKSALEKSQDEIQNLKNEILKMESASQDATNALAAEIAERHDIIQKLKADITQGKEKYQQVMIKIQFMAEVIKELRKQVKIGINGTHQKSSTDTKIAQELEKQIAEILQPNSHAILGVCDSVEHASVIAKHNLCDNNSAVKNSSKSSSVNGTTNGVLDAEECDGSVAQSFRDISQQTDEETVFKCSQCQCDNKLMNQAQNMYLSNVKSLRNSVYTNQDNLPSLMDATEERTNCFDVIQHQDPNCIVNVERDFTDTFVQTDHVDSEGADLHSGKDNSEYSTRDKIDLMTRLKNLEHQLIKVKDEEQAKAMLISQLQTHLTTSCSEVELKTTTLFNIEAKLQKARDDNRGMSLKLSELIEELDTRKIEIQSCRDINSDLQTKLTGKEEEVSMLKSFEEEIQNQRQLLMIQLDERGTELLRTRDDNLILVRKLEERQLEVQNLMLTIQNLQKAVIQEKRIAEDAKNEAKLKDDRINQIQGEFEESQEHCRKCFTELMLSEENLSTAKNENCLMRKEIQSLKAQLDNLKNKAYYPIELAENEILSIQHKKNQLKEDDGDDNQLEVFQEESEERMIELEKQLLTGKKLVEDLHKELLKMEMVVKQQDQDMTLAKQDLAAKNDEIDHYEKINSALRKELKIIEAGVRYESLQSDQQALVNGSSHATTISKVNTDNESISIVKRSYLQSQDDLNMKSLEVLSLRSENSILKEDLNVIKTEVDNLKKSNDNSCTMIQLMSELVHIKNELMQEQTKTDATEKEWKMQLDDQKNIVEREKKRSKDLEEMLKKWEKEASENRLKILDCELQIKQHKQKNEVLEAAEGYLQIKLSQFHQQLIDTRAVLSNKEDSLKIAEQQMDLKHQEVLMSTKEKEEYILWNRTLQQQIAQLNAENKVCRENVHQVMVRLCNGERVLRGHEKLMADLRNELINRNWSSDEEIAGSKWNEIANNEL